MLRGEPAWKVRQRFAGAAGTRGWKTLTRWQRQLLAPLFGWLSRQLGFREAARDREGCRRRLARLLSLHGAAGGSSMDQIQAVVRHLVGATAHAGSVGWVMQRGPPAALRAAWPRGAGS